MSWVSEFGTAALVCHCAIRNGSNGHFYSQLCRKCKQTRWSLTCHRGPRIITDKRKFFSHNLEEDSTRNSATIHHCGQLFRFVNPQQLQVTELSASHLQLIVNVTKPRYCYWQLFWVGKCHLSAQQPLPSSTCVCETQISHRSHHRLMYEQMFQVCEPTAKTLTKAILKGKLKGRNHLTVWGILFSCEHEDKR